MDPMTLSPGSRDVPATRALVPLLLDDCCDACSSLPADSGSRPGSAATDSPTDSGPRPGSDEKDSPTDSRLDSRAGGAS